jgi:hypothetical protein
MMTTRRAKMTEPLGAVTTLFGGLLLIFLAYGVVTTAGGWNSFQGFGNMPICVTQPDMTYGSSQWSAAGFGYSARPGSSISVSGHVQACAFHPGLGQRILYTLTSLPALLVWACALFLLWWLIRTARRSGPFTVPVAVAMRRLGWLIIAGNAAAALVRIFANDQLLGTMMSPSPAQGNGQIIVIPALLLQAMVPVPVLAGAALLTFARIIRLGADMDDEIKATV